MAHQADVLLCGMGEMWTLVVVPALPWVQNKLLAVPGLFALHLRAAEAGTR